jgi:deazaflavin-dependent oxidoreductase (nitroreductase family)
MPIPRFVAALNLRLTNPIVRHVAGWLPWFAILTHVGRRSGTIRRTPINIFRHRGRYVVALTYGPDAEWVRNVLAAGGCEIETMRRHVRLTDPERLHDPLRRLVPWPVRLVLGVIRVDDFLLLRAA